LADFLRELSDELRERIPAPKENGQPIEIPSHICRLVDFSKMFALIADRDKVFRKLGEAEKSLKQMGLSP